MCNLYREKCKVQWWGAIPSTNTVCEESELRVALRKSMGVLVDKNLSKVGSVQPEEEKAPDWP